MKKMLKIKSLKRVPMLKNSNLTARDDREKLQNCTSTSYIYILERLQLRKYYRNFARYKNRKTKNKKRQRKNEKRNFKNVKKKKIQRKNKNVASTVVVLRPP